MEWVNFRENRNRKAAMAAAKTTQTSIAGTISEKPKKKRSSVLYRRCFCIKVSCDFCSQKSGKATVPTNAKKKIQSKRKRETFSPLLLVSLSGGTRIFAKRSFMRCDLIPQVFVAVARGRHFFFGAEKSPPRSVGPAHPPGGRGHPFLEHFYCLLLAMPHNIFHVSRGGADSNKSANGHIP
jgi:hypothetical protein